MEEQGVVTLNAVTWPPGYGIWDLGFGNGRGDPFPSRCSFPHKKRGAWSCRSWAPGVAVRGFSGEKIFPDSPQKRFSSAFFSGPCWWARRQLPATACVVLCLLAPRRSAWRKAGTVPGIQQHPKTPGAPQYPNSTTVPPGPQIPKPQTRHRAALGHLGSPSAPQGSFGIPPALVLSLISFGIYFWGAGFVPCPVSLPAGILLEVPARVPSAIVPRFGCQQVTKSVPGPRGQLRSAPGSAGRQLPVPCQHWYQYSPLGPPCWCWCQSQCTKLGAWWWYW